MANYNDLKTGIDAVIKTNGRQEISGAALNAQLKNMIAELGAGYQYMGVATPATNPGTPDANVFYFASEAGTYTNFRGIVINEGEVCALVWNGTWTKQVTGAATADKLNQLGQEMNINAGDAVLAKPIATINGQDVSFQYHYDINQSTGVAFSGGYRAAVLNFLPVYNKLYITVATGFQFNLLWYSEANEASYIGSIQYTQLSEYTVPTGTKYFRMVIQRQGNSSAVTEPFDSIITQFKSISLYEDIGANCVRTDSQSLSDTKKKQALTNIGAMPYRAVSYQTCSSSASSVNKDVSVDLLSSPSIGVRLIVKMRNANAADNVTMSINGGTAYPLYYNKTRASSTNTWESGAELDVVFDGSMFYAVQFSGVVSDEGGSLTNAISQYAYTNLKKNIEEDKIKESMSIGQPFVINDFTTWKQGTVDNPGATNRTTLNDRIPVIPGHRYAIVVSRYFTQNIAGFRPEYSSTKSSTIYPASWLYRYYDTFTVPKDRYFLVISLTKQIGQTMTVENAEDCHITLIDVTGGESLGENGSIIVPITYSAASYAQGMVCHKGYIFQSFSNGILAVYSADGEQIATVDLPEVGGEKLHANALSWGDFYSSSDEFPLLIVAANNWGGKFAVIRITRDGNNFTLSTAFEVTAPSAPTGYTSGTQFVDVWNKRLVVSGYDSSDNVSLFVYEWTGTLAADTAFTLLRSYDTGLWMYAVQDGILVDNTLYFLFGVANAHSMLVAYNTESEELVKFTDLRRKVFGTIKDEEPEGIGCFGGDVYFSTTKGIYKVSL